MGFSFMKSKVVLFHAYGTLCWNKKNIGHLQGAVSSSDVVMKRASLGAHSSVFPRRFCHTNKPSQWFRKRKASWTKLVSGFSIVRSALFSALFVRVERIPYSKRFHLVISQGIENKLGESQWKDLMEEYEGKLLPPTDPEAIRAGSIAKRIIQALHSGLRLENECIVNGYGDGGTLIDCPKVVEKKSPKFSWKPATTHLNDMNWEVIVVDSNIYNAFYIPPGKILIYRGLLCSHKSDLEIAIIIGHEVGHAVARHLAEDVAFFKIFLAQLCQLYEYLIRLNLRREVEADYIGLMLMASAGYDPQEAPKVFEKFLDKGDEFLRTHRAKSLSKTEVLEEALAIYNEVRAGCGVRSFV